MASGIRSRSHRSLSDYVGVFLLGWMGGGGMEVRKEGGGGGARDVH